MNQIILYTDTDKKTQIFSFEYENEIHRFIIRVINNRFAWLAGINEHDMETELDKDYKLVGSLSGDTKMAFSGKLPIVHHDSYIIYYKNKPIFKLNEIRQQEITKIINPSGT
jgi:hypothetical protein